jgi:hypothetical protein
MTAVRAQSQAVRIGNSAQDFVMKLLGLCIALLCVFPAGSLVAEMDDEATLRHFKTVLWPQAYRNQEQDQENP